MRLSTTIMLSFFGWILAGEYSPEYQKYQKDINPLIMAIVMFCLWHIVRAIEDLRR